MKWDWFQMDTKCRRPSDVDIRGSRNFIRTQIPPDSVGKGRVGFVLWSDPYYSPTEH